MKRFDDKTLFNPRLAGAAGAVVSNIGSSVVVAGSGSKAIGAIEHQDLD